MLQHTWLVDPSSASSSEPLFPNAAPIGKGPFDGPPKPRGAHAMVELYDGTFLVVGGMNGSDTSPVGTWALDDAWIFAP